MNFMTHREWKSDLYRREHEFVAVRTPEPRMSAIVRYALNVDDMVMLRQLDIAFQDANANLVR